MKINVHDEMYKNNKRIQMVWDTDITMNRDDGSSVIKARVKTERSTAFASHSTDRRK